MSAVVGGAVPLSPGPAVDHEAAAEYGPIDAGTPTDTATMRAERVLLRTALLFRATGLVQIAVTAVAHQSGRHATLLLWLAASVFIESAVLTRVVWRAQRITAPAIGADVAFNVAALTANAALMSRQDALTWAYFMYGFTIPMSIAIGIAYRRLSSVLITTAVLAAGYAVPALAFGLEQVWNAIPDTFSYFADTSVTWLIARELRRSARALDAGRAQAVADAATLARERERSRHARILHDRVLQTMETLARGTWISDATLRAHIAGEAVWLRALVQGDPLDQPGDLLAELQEIVRRRALLGLRVQFNDTALRQAPDIRARIPGPIVDALTGAAEEALTNVAKHAGVDTAVLRASLTADTVTISVVDHGRGFDPSVVTGGLGLPECIHGRIRAVGGQAEVTSAPGLGTQIEIAAALQP